MIVPYCRDRNLMEWRCGVQLYHHMSRAGLSAVEVQLVDGRIIQGGVPHQLVAHGCADVEQLLLPCLEAVGMADRLAEVATQWREYLTSSDTFLYTPIFMGRGTVPGRELTE